VIAKYLVRAPIDFAFDAKQEIQRLEICVGKNVVGFYGRVAKRCARVICGLIAFAPSIWLESQDLPDFRRREIGSKKFLNTPYS
jgi:hypothetical protein